MSFDDYVRVFYFVCILFCFWPYNYFCHESNQSEEFLLINYLLFWMINKPRTIYLSH